MYRNICLIGLPFSGKSLLGKRLSIKQKVGFIEIDTVKYFEDYEVSLQKKIVD